MKSQEDLTGAEHSIQPARDRLTRPFTALIKFLKNYKRQLSKEALE